MTPFLLMMLGLYFDHSSQAAPPAGMERVSMSSKPPATPKEQPQAALVPLDAPLPPSGAALKKKRIRGRRIASLHESSTNVLDIQAAGGPYVIDLKDSASTLGFLGGYTVFGGLEYRGEVAKGFRFEVLLSGQYVNFSPPSLYSVEGAQNFLFGALGGIHFEVARGFDLFLHTGAFQRPFYFIASKVNNVVVTPTWTPQFTAGASLVLFETDSVYMNLTADGSVFALYALGAERSVISGGPSFGGHGTLEAGFLLDPTQKGGLALTVSFEGFMRQYLFGAQSLLEQGLVGGLGLRWIPQFHAL
jgi:hypothetical protein